MVVFNTFTDDDLNVNIKSGGVNPKKRFESLKKEPFIPLKSKKKVSIVGPNRWRPKRFNNVSLILDSSYPLQARILHLSLSSAVKTNYGLDLKGFIRVQSHETKYIRPYYWSRIRIRRWLSLSRFLNVSALLERKRLGRSFYGSWAFLINKVKLNKSSKYSSIYMFKEFFSSRSDVYFGSWSSAVEGNSNRIWYDCFYDSHVHKFKYLNPILFEKSFGPSIKENKKILINNLFRDHFLSQIKLVNNSTINNKKLYSLFNQSLTKVGVQVDTYREFKRILWSKWLYMFKPYVISNTLFKSKSKVALFFLRQNSKALFWENKLDRDSNVMNIYSMLKNHKEVDILNRYIERCDFYIKSRFIRPYWLRPQGLKYFPPYNFLGLNGRFFLHRRLFNPQNLPICIIRVASRNVFITVINSSGVNVICKQSAGAAGFKGPKRRTPYAAEMTGKSVGELLQSLGIKSILVAFKSSLVHRFVKSAFRGLISVEGIKIHSLVNIRFLAHSFEVRPKKQRRL